MTRLLALAALGLVCSAALVACGGAEGAPARSVEAPAERAPAPPPPPPPEPTSVEEAQRQIAYAATEINTQTLNVAKPEGKPASSADADTSKPPHTVPKQEPSGNGGASKASEYQHDELVNRCASPCRALASMQRAVDALCRMTGETDAKCVDARKTLADNVGRTATCKCGS